MKKHLASKKKRAQRLGRRGEWLCRQLLRLKGYRIISHNWVSPYGEIDIIAKKASVLICVEVKTRSTDITQGALISPAQKHRIQQTCRYLLQRNPQWQTCFLRFDVMIVSQGFPRHIQNAWQDMP